jgi:hypothetical protein
MDEMQIDLCSSNNSTPCMLQNVTVRLLAAANQASFQNLIQEVEINYLYSRSADKDFIVVEGATTGVTPCTNCPLSASAYSNVTKQLFSTTRRNGSTTGSPKQISSPISYGCALARSDSERLISMTKLSIRKTYDGHWKKLLVKPAILI